LVLFIIFLLLILRRKKKTYHSRWSTLIPNFQYSSTDFYSKLEDEFLSHDIGSIEVSEVSLKESSMLSDTRLYQKVVWKGLNYHICAAPFGDGFFISWWLQNEESWFSIIISRIPIFGGFLNRLFFPVTFYKIDTASMFMTYAQSSVLKIVDEIASNSGGRSLSAEERKPIMGDLFKR
jgi:hypothetical protein